MKEYFDAATEPKQQHWYDTGHDLNDIDVMLDRALWLRRYIEIPLISPFLQKKLKRSFIR
jgi:hypothetical protein